ncbi:MAG: glycosyltransferase family 4 protein [Actinomycetota bacterium]
MRIVIVSSIFPPDIGGPASHAADLRDALNDRGHFITIVSLCDARAEERGDGIIRFPRQGPWVVRLMAVVRWLIRNRSAYDVIYATGLHSPAVIGARLARRPVVVKVVGDAAWERASRQGLTTLSFDKFQVDPHSSKRVSAMRRLRNWSLRNADAITVPSRYLAEIVQNWTGRDQVEVIPNGVGGPLERFSGVRRSDRLKLAFVGRLVPHKRVPTILDAMARLPDVFLEVIGDGPSRPELEDHARSLGLVDRVSFCGALPRDEVFQRLASSHALILASDYEGLPHTAIESLAVGTPVIATPAGGTTEVVVDQKNGLIIEGATPDAIAATVERLRDDGFLRERLIEGARQDAVRWRFDNTADRVEDLLAHTAMPRPSVMFIGKTSIPRELGADLRAKHRILSKHLRATVITTGPARLRKIDGVRVVTVPRLRPQPLGSLLFYSIVPVAACLATAFGRGRAMVVQSPYEGFGACLSARLLPKRLRPRLVVEVHGDWRTAGRLYGSRFRRLVAPLAEACASWTLKRADRVRVVSDAMEELVRATGYGGTVDKFVAFSTFDIFLVPDAAPAPERTRVAFVGVLQASKGVDIILDAWPSVLHRVPNAELTVAGNGPMSEELRRQAARLGINESVRFLPATSREGVRELLDDSSCVVLPSRSEGLGRLVIEAMARSRPVVATRVGGIPELVEHGHTGLLVDPGDPEDLARSLAAILRDPKRARKMGQEGRARALALDPARNFESGIERLARWIGPQR